jgi:hypothetical protein
VAESKDAAKGSSGPKKQPKKLVIVDANESSAEPAAPSTPPVKKTIDVTEHSGDTPPLNKDDAELASLAQAIDTIGSQPKAVKAAKSAKAAAKTSVDQKTDQPKVAEAEPVTRDDTGTNNESVADAEPDSGSEVESEHKPEPETEAATDEAPVIDEDMTVGEAIDASPELTAQDSQDAQEVQNDESMADESQEPATGIVAEPTPVDDEPSVTDVQQDAVPKQSVTPEAVAVADELAKPIAKPAAKAVLIDDFTDDATARRIDDIVAKESDELLAREDADAIRKQVAVKKQSKIKKILSEWWVNPATKWGTIVGILLLLVGIAALPSSRYFILNTAGVRASSSIIISSADSQQPLKNVDVALADQSVKTDDKGIASFKKLKLGKHALTISKRGYETINQSKVLGWGSNPLGQITLNARGTKYSFVVTDFLSGKPITSAEAISGDFNAQADKDGKLLLAVDQNNDKDLSITIKAGEYRDQVVTVKLAQTAQRTIQMIPDRKHIFVSKRSGKLDIYKIDADGKNEEKLLAATGSERDDMALLPHPTSNYTALVTTRDNKHNKDGYLLSTLYVLDNKTAELTKIVQSERVQLIDWTNERIVFIAVTEGASAANPARSKLFSYEIGQPGPKEIASANYFNDAVVFKGIIYYAPSSYAIPVNSVKFFKVNADGSSLSTVLDHEVWNIFRSEYDTLLLSVQQDWYTLKNNEQPTKLTSAPANPKSRTYKESPDKKHALWVDVRDGKGVLLSYSYEDKKDDTIQSQAGLGMPMYWLSSNTVVYRVSDGHETADYIKNIDGGDAKKLRDVTATDIANYFN